MQKGKNIVASMKTTVVELLFAVNSGVERMSRLFLNEVSGSNNFFFRIKLFSKMDFYGSPGVPQALGYL